MGGGGVDMQHLPNSKGQLYVGVLFFTTICSVASWKLHHFCQFNFGWKCLKKNHLMFCKLHLKCFASKILKCAIKILKYFLRCTLTLQDCYILLIDHIIKLSSVLIRNLFLFLFQTHYHSLSNSRETNVFFCSYQSNKTPSSLEGINCRLVWNLVCHNSIHSHNTVIYTKGIIEQKL